MGRLQAQRRVQLGIEINRGTLGWLAHRASRKILTFQHYSVTPLKRQTLLKTRPASQAGFTGRRAGVAYGSLGDWTENSRQRFSTKTAALRKLPFAFQPGLDQKPRNRILPRQTKRLILPPSLRRQQLVRTEPPRILELVVVKPDVGADGGRMKSDHQR